MHDNILVPIDGSPHAFKALDLAADIAGVYQSTVHLMHVAQLQEVPEGLKQWARLEHVVDSASWMLESGAAQNLLIAARERLAGRGVTRVEEIIEHGNVAKTIINFAGSAGIDMIVMGTRGFSDLGGLVMGSVAHKVSHAAPCTVVMVR